MLKPRSTSDCALPSYERVLPEFETAFPADCQTHHQTHPLLLCPMLHLQTSRAIKSMCYAKKYNRPATHRFLILNNIFHYYVTVSEYSVITSQPTHYYRPFQGRTIMLTAWAQRAASRVGLPCIYL